LKKLLVYDLDGTIVDSARTVLEIINILRLELKKPLLTKKKIIPFLSVGGEYLIQNALEIEKNKVRNYLDIFRHEYFKKQTNVNHLYPGIEETLKELVKEYKISICTNKPRMLAKKILDETNLSKYIDYMCAGDDLLTQKPDKENLFNCVNYFSFEIKETILIGDSAVDQALANNCDLDFVHYSQGYDDGVIKNNSTKKIEHHKEILQILMGYKNEI